MPNEKQKIGLEQSEAVAEALAHLFFEYWQNGQIKSDRGLNDEGRVTDKLVS